MTKAKATTAVKTALTVAQRNYMSTRLDAIANGKKDVEYKKIFNKERSAYFRSEFNPTIVEMVAALKSGKAKIKPGCEDRRTLDIDYLDWDAKEKAKAEHDKKVAQYAEFCVKLDNEKQCIMDGVMLGTAEDAMAALEAFAKA